MLLKDRIDDRNWSPIFLQDFPFSPFDLLSRIVRTLETLVPSVTRHHNRVAMVAAAIARDMDFSQAARSRLVRSCLVHDIGIFVNPELWGRKDYGGDEYWENISTLEGFHRSLDMHAPLAKHALRGYHLFRRFEALSDLALPVLLHHYPWKLLRLSNFDDETKTIAAVMNVADRVAVILSAGAHPLSQRSAALSHLKGQSPTGEYDPAVAAVAEKMLQRRKDVAMDMKFIDSWKQDLLESARQPSRLSYGELFRLFDVLSNITDAKSPFTLMHTTNVLYTASTLAQQLGLPDVDVLNIELAAVAHDLGKIATPNKILHKQGPLDELELPVMQEHVYISFLLLKDLPGLREVVFTAATHHERLNGSGYPWGLSGEQLPLASRILQVADVYSAMREDRPYRKGMSLKEVLGRLNSMASDSLLDLRVVRALGEAGDTFRFIPEALSSRRRNFYHPD
jgi:HD-GYP domain-containing protein (c-di-GMP phosphodiesterase class II)